MSKHDPKLIEALESLRREYGLSEIVSALGDYAHSIESVGSMFDVRTYVKKYHQSALKAATVRTEAAKAHAEADFQAACEEISNVVGGPCLYPEGPARGKALDALYASAREIVGAVHALYTGE